MQGKRKDLTPKHKSTETQSTQETHQLMRHLGFSETDLAANRAGCLSKTQVKGLEKLAFNRQWWILGALLGGLATCCIGLAFVFGEGTLLVVGLGLWIVFTAAKSVLHTTAHKARMDLFDGRVEAKEGVVHYQQRGRWTDLYVGGVLWEAPHLLHAINRFKLLRAFGEGQPYRIYYAPNTRAILSIEPLGD